MRVSRCHAALMLSLGLLSLSAGLSSACAQASAPDPQSSVPVIKANTHAVVVDVVVTQGRDEPVSSLHKQDFTLIEDGKPQTVDYFEEHTTPLANKPVPPAPPLPPHVYTNVPAAPSGDSVNVLLLDSLNTPRQDQTYVHQQILEFLKTMKPQARIAIFTLGSRLRYIQGFTDDPALLQAALNDKNYGFQPTTTTVSRSRSDDDDDKAEVNAKAAAFGGTSRGAGGSRGNGTAGVSALLQSQAEYGQYEVDQRVAITLGALQALGRYLAGIPGRKNLIWFASTYPVYFFPKSTEKQPFNNHREYTNEIKATADMLTISKVAVYPISAEGMMNDHPMDSEHDYQAAGAGGALMANIMAGAGQRSDTITAMQQIAADTGGEAIYNTNGLDLALDRVIQNGAHYYTLVYTPLNKQMDGQFRHIQVKLPNEHKYKLSYRRGYYAETAAETAPAYLSHASVNTTNTNTTNASPGPSKGQANSNTQLPAQFSADPLQPLLALGMPSSSQILFGVRVEPASQQPPASARRAGDNAKLPGPTTRYNLNFLIDGKQIVLEPGPDGARHAKFQVSLVAYDRDGKAVNWIGGIVLLKIDDKTYSDYLRVGIPTHLEVDLPNAPVLLTAGIFDYKSLKAGTIEIALASESTPAATPSKTN